MKRKMFFKLTTAFCVIAFTLSMVACSSKKDVQTVNSEEISDTASANENTETQLTEETDESPIAEVTEDSEVSEEEATSGVVIFESDLGYTTQYNPSLCTLESVDGYDRFLCTVDDNNNYVSICVNTEYTVDELVEGLVLQSGTDEVISGESYFGKDSLESKYVIYNTDHDTNMQFTLIPLEEGVLMIECGSHIYADDDYTFYEIEAALSDIFNCLEIRQN